MEQKESSVLFSLKGLMNLEEDRIRQEEDEKRKAVQLAADAKLAAERRTREAEEARLLAQEERRREEAARLEAIRHAEVERARLDAENAARMDAMRQQQEHERHIATIKAKGKSKQQAVLTAGAMGGLLAFLVGGVVTYNENERAKARTNSQQAQIDQANIELAKARSALEDKNAQVSQLQSAIASAKDEGAKQTRQLPTSGTIRSHQATPAAQSSAAPRKPCACTPGDPLCSCIP